MHKQENPVKYRGNRDTAITENEEWLIVIIKLGL
jgi:hypothetical protein